MWTTQASSWTNFQSNLTLARRLEAFSAFSTSNRRCKVRWLSRGPTATFAIGRRTRCVGVSTVFCPTRSCSQRLASAFRHSEKSFQRWDGLPPFRQVVNPSKLGPPARVVPCTHPWASPLMPHAEHQGVVPDLVLVPDRRGPPPRREKTALERRFPARSPLSVHRQPVHGVERPADAGV